jgi:hypothetical protein
VPQRDSIERVALVLAFMVAGSAAFTQASGSKWKRFTSKEGAFTILMPGKSKVENATRVISGIQMEVHTISAWSRTGGYFSVAYADAPMPTSIDVGERMLEAQRQVLTHGDDNRMLSAEKMTVNGYSARQYKAVVEEGLQADEKLYLVGRRLYILLVVHDKGGDEGDVKNFFDSFTFDPKG